MYTSIYHSTRLAPQCYAFHLVNNILCCIINNCSDAKYKIIHQTSQATRPRCSAKSSRIEPCIPGAFKPSRRLPQYCYYRDKTRCKKPSLSYYHRVVNAALPQFLPWFYHQFSATSHSIHPVKQSHNVVYLEATDLLATRNPIPSFL